MKLSLLTLLLVACAHAIPGPIRVVPVPSTRDCASRPPPKFIPVPKPDYCDPGAVCPSGCPVGWLCWRVEDAATLAEDVGLALGWIAETWALCHDADPSPTVP